MKLRRHPLIVRFFYLARASKEGGEVVSASLAGWNLHLVIPFLGYSRYFSCYLIVNDYNILHACQEDVKMKKRS